MDKQIKEYQDIKNKIENNESEYKGKKGKLEDELHTIKQAFQKKYGEPIRELMGEDRGPIKYKVPIGMSGLLDLPEIKELLSISDMEGSIEIMDLLERIVNEKPYISNNSAGTHDLTFKGRSILRLTCDKVDNQEEEITTLELSKKKYETLKKIIPYCLHVLREHNGSGLEKAGVTYTQVKKLKKAI